MFTNQSVRREFRRRPRDPANRLPALKILSIRWTCVATILKETFESWDNYWTSRIIQITWRLASLHYSVLFKNLIIFQILEAAARVIQRRLGPDAVRPPTKKSNDLAYSLKDAPQFAFADKDLDEAAKILRLLQIHSVRHLQTTINETIVAVQELTANPKTDTKLGKVGF